MSTAAPIRRRIYRDPITAVQIGELARDVQQQIDQLSADTGPRPPSAHHTTHEAGGSDEIKLDDLGSPDDNTDLNATTSAHGLLPKLPGGTSKFLRGDGTFATPASINANYYYAGKVTAGNGTGNWSATTYADCIGASQPIAAWTDIGSSGISRSNSAFTFTNAGTYLWHSTLPINGVSAYVSVRLNGSSGGVLFERTNFHGSDAVGQGERPWCAVITVVASEVVTIQYAKGSAGSAGSYSAPPTISSASVSVGGITIFRLF